MNNIGDISVGALITIFIGIIVALILLGGISPYLGITTKSVTATNVTYTPANGSYTDLAGQELLSTPIVTNSTGDEAAFMVWDSGNYTIDEGISTTTGLKTIRFNWSTTSDVAGTPVNISYDYGADGYIESSAGRSMVTLIPIFAALAILVFTLFPTLRSKILESFGK